MVMPAYIRNQGKSGDNGLIGGLLPLFSCVGIFVIVAAIG